MKRFFLGTSLACAVLLLSACPDTKLPTPSPKVPEPKALSTTQSIAEKIYVQGNAAGNLPTVAARQG